MDGRSVGENHRAIPSYMPRTLPNYLSMHRKRAGLSQDDVAFLLGCQHGTLVSRYERARRQPTLETALSYEAILGVPARELFAGAFEKVEQRTGKRAQLLARRLSRRTADPSILRKLTELEQIVSGRSAATREDYEESR
jgi:transcriptional regulator with XRE-family HTH domain